jgi:Fe-S cluster assembly protein SufD
MLTFHKNENVNTEVPSTIQKLLTNLENYIVVKDGVIIQESYNDTFQELYIKEVDEALVEMPDLFDGELFKSFSDDAYNYNFEECNSGLVIFAKRNQVFNDTLHVFYVQSEGEFVNNTTILMDQNSELNYFEYLYNESETSYNFVSNTFVGENAKLIYGGLSRLQENALVSIRRNSYVERYGNSFYSVAEVNDSTTDSKTNIYLIEQYASGTSKTVAITNKNQEASFKQTVEHKAPDTEGFIENYGVANNNSILVFEGTGKIHKDMKRSIARQSNRGIVLGKTSRLDANPLLLIDEFDVEASHGAAIGKIDEEQLYYLMSRGLTLKNAERLIINGFLSPVLELLKTDELVEDFVNTVENKTL